MSLAGKRMIKAARAALKFSRILGGVEMVDAERHTTVFVTKSGKVLGTVHGQKPAGWRKSDR